MESFHTNKDKDAVIWKDQSYSYSWIIDKVSEFINLLESPNLSSNMVFSVEGEASPSLIAFFLAMAGQNRIIVPVAPSVDELERDDLKMRSGVGVSFLFDGEDNYRQIFYQREPENKLVIQLIDDKEPGLILFSSGSTGKSKGAVHNLNRLLEKHQTPVKAWRSIIFLLLDHIGGINTLFSILSGGGTLVMPKSRKIADICYAVEKHKVDLLPVTPTFLNLLFLSEEYNNYSLDSLRLITYGTEPMPDYTLNRALQIFPKARFKQTYGLSELGIMPTKSKNNSSVWLKLGGDNYQYRILDNILWIKTSSAMLGYLDSPSPFSFDGWFKTEDLVEEKDGYLRIIGRESEIINVGGQKVYPVEVENVLLELDNIEEVTVNGELNPILGQIVCARISLKEHEDISSLKKRIRIYCRKRLESYKIPVKIEVTEEVLYSERFKKMRNRQI